jgi:hypothetical protein
MVTIAAAVNDAGRMLTYFFIIHPQFVSARDGLWLSTAKPFGGRDFRQLVKSLK